MHNTGVDSSFITPPRKNFTYTRNLIKMLAMSIHKRAVSLSSQFRTFPQINLHTGGTSCFITHQPCNMKLYRFCIRFGSSTVQMIISLSFIDYEPC